MSDKDSHTVLKHYEKDDVSLAKMLGVIGAVMVLSALLIVVWWCMFDASLTALRPSQRFPEMQIGTRGELPATAGGLIERRAVGLERVRQDNKRLQSYGWVNRDRGIVRIPIEQAMDIIASGGL